MRYVPYKVSKIGLCALTRIQQRQFDQDPRRDIIVNSVHPGFVDTDMSNHEGDLTIEQGTTLMKTAKLRDILIV